MAAFINNLEVAARQEIWWVKTPPAPTPTSGFVFCETLTAVPRRRRK